MSATDAGGEPAEPKYRDADWLREQLVARGRPTDKVADECGVVPQTISKWSSKHDIPDQRGADPEYEPEECLQWLDSFVALFGVVPSQDDIEGLAGAVARRLSAPVRDVHRGCPRGRPHPAK
jgi:hypothetical protein